MQNNKSRIVISLKIVSAQAQKLAMDLDDGRLWEGQLYDGLMEINKQLSDALSMAVLR